MCSADYPVTAEDAYRTRLKPWERDDAERVYWDPYYLPELEKEEGRIRIWNNEKSPFLTFLQKLTVCWNIQRTSLSKWIRFILFIYLLNYLT